MGNYTILYMFENPRRGRQARNFTTNAPKILVLKSSSEQTFSRKLPLGAPGGFVTVCLISSKQRILVCQINLTLIWQLVCSNKCAVICPRVVMTQKHNKCSTIFTLKRYNGVVLVTNLIIWSHLIYENVTLHS